MTPSDFIAAIAPSAQANQQKSGIPASFTIAQAALESAWGSSGLAQQAFNLFGIKADSSWTGPSVTMLTHEVANGQSIVVSAAFRKYEDWGASVDDHAAFLQRNRRYQPAFDHTGDPEAFARSVAAAGYATDPDYADKVIGVIRAHDLTQFDQAGATVAVPGPGSEPVQPPQPIQPEATMPGEADISTSQPIGATSPASSDTVAAVAQGASTVVRILNPGLGFIWNAVQQLAPVTPELVRLFGGSGAIPERNAKALEMVGGIIRNVGGASTEQQAASNIANDPAKIAQLRSSLMDQWSTIFGMIKEAAEIQESSFDRAAARAAKEPTDFAPALIKDSSIYLYAITAALFVGWIADIIWNQAKNFATFIALVGASLTWAQKVKGTQQDHRFGSSAGSEAKNALIDKLSTSK